MRDVSRQRACTGFLAAALSVATALPLAGQAVRTVLVGAGTGELIAGALVSLVDTTGLELRRTMTDATGAVRFDLPPGAYRLRVFRIGVARWETGVFRLASGDTFTTTLRAPEQPITLAPLTVRAERRCRLRPEEGSAAATLWEEARKAMEATEWTIRSRLYRFQTVSYVRVYGPVGGNPTAEERTVGTGLSAWPFESIPLDSLNARGFVQTDAKGEAHYYGPDLTVLFSEMFLTQHCFKVRTNEQDSLVGLGFEPVASRRVNDIAGVLWLDRRSMELRHLEFSYTRLGGWVGRGALGVIAFERLPSRGWVIRRWFIRAPIPRLGATRAVDGGYGTAGPRDTLGVGGYREEGAHVVTVMTAGGQPVAVYPEEP
jgi:carboxypeptidase family protein